MQRVLVLGVFLALLAGGAAAGVAFAADAALGDVHTIEPSAPAGLLAPITIEGRKGWDCVAERNATSASLPDAALPAR